MAPPKNYMIPLQFPAGLYDYAKPPGPFAQWTSAPLYSYEEFARSNPRKGKYADVLTQHGKEGFVFPEKAPRVGSFPLYPLKSAKRAIQVVTLPSFDHKPEQRERVIRAAVSAHPSLKSEAERLLARASDRMARSKRPCEPVPCEPVPCAPVKRTKKSSAPEGSLDARIEHWRASMLPRTKKYLSEGTKEMRGWGKYNGAMYMSDGHIAIPGYIGPTDEEYFNKTFRTYVRDLPVDKVFPDRSSLEEIYVTHVPTKEEAKEPSEDDYNLIRTTRAHAVNPKLMGIVANAVGPNLSLFQGPDPLSPIVVRGDKGEALIMPMRLTKSARKNRSDRKGRAKRNGGGGMPHPYDVPGNAGPFWPDAYPYGAKGRPMAYGPTARELAAAKGNPETVDPAWKAAAERLLEKRKGKSIDDFTYRAYLRAILQGAMPVTHKDGIPYIGALEARQDLIDEYGKGPSRKNPRSSGKGRRAMANPLLSSQKEIQTMRMIWDLGGSGVFDKDLEASGVDMNIVSDLTRRGLLHRKKARSPSRFGTENWSITEDGLTAMRNAKMSMALPNRSKRPSTRTRHNPTAWQKEMRKTSVPKRSKFEVTSIDYIREGTYAFDLDLGKDGYGRITLYPDGYMQSGIMNLTPALRAKMGAWVKKHAKKIKAIPEFGRTYPGNW